MEETVKTIEVTENGKTMGVIMAMTPEEANDKVFVKEMEETQQAKTADRLRHTPDKPAPKYSKEQSQGALKEFNEHKQWHEQNPSSRKYYGGFTL